MHRLVLEIVRALQPVQDRRRLPPLTGAREHISSTSPSGQVQDHLVRMVRICCPMLNRAILNQRAPHCLMRNVNDSVPPCYSHRMPLWCTCFYGSLPTQEERLLQNRGFEITVLREGRNITCTDIHYMLIAEPALAEVIVCQVSSCCDSMFRVKIPSLWVRF
ncbi:hypothetical protein FBUS_09311 [Fasciolopsis buskii]|uniref:Uncharacterized protein n=1 Tax=Fasciolopsis buskii TaxID=27845 RepID=A0A8E0RK39_9TREM|nr:hypothetical protein FBUS_09311 [Fasciolopsis buski]